MPAISLRSLLTRERIRRRSVSIFVSPGPRVPMPPPPATRPPACRDSDSPQPRSRGSMYCICASSTCALPSRLLACWAKMSRISAVRSTTLTLSTFSSWLSWPGVSSPSQIDGVGAAGGDEVADLVGLARAHVGGGVRPVAALADGLEHLGPGGLGQRGELGQRPVGVGLCSLGPHADQHDALEAQLPVLDLGDVGELGGQPRDPAQRTARLEVVGAGGLVRLVPLPRPASAILGSGVGVSSAGVGRSGVRGGRHRLQRGTPRAAGHLSCHHRVQRIAPSPGGVPQAFPTCGPGRAGRTDHAASARSGPMSGTGSSSLGSNSETDDPGREPRGLRRPAAQSARRRPRPGQWCGEPRAARARRASR